MQNAPTMQGESEANLALMMAGEAAASPPRNYDRAEWKSPDVLRWPTLDSWKRYIDGLKPDSFFYNRAKQHLFDGLGLYSSNHAWHQGPEFFAAYDYLKEVAFSHGFYITYTRSGGAFTDKGLSDGRRMLFSWDHFRQLVLGAGTWAVTLPDGTPLQVVEIDHAHQCVCCQPAAGISDWYDHLGHVIFWRPESGHPRPPHLMLTARRTDRKEDGGHA